MKDIPKFDFSNIDKIRASSSVDITKYNLGINDEFKKVSDSIAKANQKKLQRDIENNENLKAIVDYNEELVNLNNKILKKINSLDDTLSFLNSTFNDKSKFDKEKSIEQTALLLELMNIIEEKDNNKLEKFMSNVGAPLGVGLLLECLKIKFGLS